MSESNEGREEPLFEAPDVEVPTDAPPPVDAAAEAAGTDDAGAPGTGAADGDVDPDESDVPADVRVVVDAGIPLPVAQTPGGEAGVLGEAPDIEVPSDAPAPEAAARGRSSRFTRSDSGDWVARRSSTEPFDADADASAALAATGVLAADAASDADDDTDDEDDEAEARRRRRSRRPRKRRMWLQGGTSTQHWDWLLVGWAVVSLGAGVLVATAATEFVGGVLGGWIGTIALWVAMIVPTVYALTRSVPRGLFRFRWTDVLFGLVFGVLLRIVAGLLEQSARGASVWPSYPTVDGQLAGDWWFGDLVVPVVIAPAVEELFFHVLLLVALYTAFRRLTRVRAVAGFGAALVSTGLFVLLHELTGSLGTTWASGAAIALVGLVGATLVLVTGRIWGALLTHVVFNASYVVLALVGTMAGLGGGVGLS
ncbi:CPBP family intramembrane glutamic endopeptidase [Microbacterium sp. 18062]|uniref:CPBP family intramembrane glutamic endopeptidase n=1 Tax=Microbacterium sp. 18062 TaxID=2681410 RepID=UPI001358BE04|nr:CPBP family glutamic-type intramembrane protease [Microbacterium sp. 18062]